MDAQRSSRLNHLLTTLPEGFLADSAWLQAQGLSRSSIRDYVDRGWLERIGPRVYRRPGQTANAQLRWDVAVLSLQQIMRRTMATQAQSMGSVKDIQAHLRHAKADTTANEYMQELPESVKRMVASVYAMLIREGQQKQVLERLPPKATNDLEGLAVSN